MGVRALVADDHPLCREIAKAALAVVTDVAEIVEAASLDDVMDIGSELNFIVLDLGLRDSHGLASLIEVARRWPDTPILILSGEDKPGVVRELAAYGAAGFVSKAAPITAIIEAMRVVLDGGTCFPAEQAGMGAANSIASRLASLSPAESRVLRAMRGGRLNKQIAFDLSLSEITIKQHVKAILRKLEVVNRTQAILLLHGAETWVTDPKE